MKPYGMTKEEYHNDSRKSGDKYVRGRPHNSAGDMRDFRKAKKRERRMRLFPFPDEDNYDRFLESCGVSREYLEREEEYDIGEDYYGRNE